VNCAGTHPQQKKLFDFVKMIADHALDSSHIMCSFDVKSLFSNFPIGITVNFILDKVFADGESKSH